MKNKMLILSLVIAGTAAAPALALKSIADIFKDPKITKVSPEMQIPSMRAQMLEGLTAAVENPYNMLNAQYGDATTLACEETISTQLLNLFRSAIKNSIKEADYIALKDAYTKLFTHLSKKTGVDEQMISQFIAIIIARRITIAGLEFSVEQAGKTMTPAQQAQCGTLIQKINDVTMEFLVNTVGLSLMPEGEEEEAPAQA